MSFNQDTFAPVGANSTDTPKVFSYKTTDSLATVLTSGYFDDKRFQLDSGDIILSDISGTFSIIQIMTATPSVVTTNQVFSTPANQLIINSLSDFPNAVGGVITLADDTFYLIGDNLAVTTDRFVLGADTVVAGLDSSASSISYSGTETMFTSVDNSNKITLLTLDCPNGKLHDISSTGPASVFQLINCTVDNVDEIGNLSNLVAIQYSDVAFNNIITKGITFIGTFGIFIGSTDLITINGSTPFFDLGTAVFDSFDISASLATLAAGANFISGLTNSGNISSGNSGSIRGVKTFGTGTPLSGITVDDVRWFFSGNDDIPDTNPDSLLSLKNNADATVITASSTDGTNAVLINGVWVDVRKSFFEVTASGRVTYKGERPLTVPIDLISTLAPVGDDTLALYIAFNGTPIVGSGIPRFVKASDPGVLSTMWQVNFTFDDFIEPFVENQTGTNNILSSDAILRVN